MIFGNWPVEEAEGTVLGYAVAAGAHSFRKGTLLTSDHLSALKQHGVTHIFAARLEKDDISENDAALAIAKFLLSNHVEAGPPATGRVNIFSRHDGLFHADASAIDAINLLDPRVSIATLPNDHRIELGQMVATVKIIPFAIPTELIERILTTQNKSRAIDVRPFKAMRIGLIQSRLPSIRETVLDKTKELISSRIKKNHGSVSIERRVTHEQTALSHSIQEVTENCDLTIVFSASSVADEADIVPRAIKNCGGEIMRIGVPVDPGNLLVLAKLHGKYIVIAPGSARSARANSLDGILDRLMAGVRLHADDLGKMGVGGLLI